MSAIYLWTISSKNVYVNCLLLSFYILKFTLFLWIYLKITHWSSSLTHGSEQSQIAMFMGPTWGPPGSCRPQMGPMLDPWTLLSGGTSYNLNHWWSAYKPMYASPDAHVLRTLKFEIVVSVWPVLYCVRPHNVLNSLSRITRRYLSRNSRNSTHILRLTWTINRGVKSWPSHITYEEPTRCQLFGPLWPLLLTWFNFNLSMDK